MKQRALKIVMVCAAVLYFIASAILLNHLYHRSQTEFLISSSAVHFWRGILAFFFAWLVCYKKWFVICDKKKGKLKAKPRTILAALALLFLGACFYVINLHLVSRLPNPLADFLYFPGTGLGTLDPILAFIAGGMFLNGFYRTERP